MGNCCTTEKITKSGNSYKGYRKNIRPFDLVLFKGADGVSGLIRQLSKWNQNLDGKVDTDDMFSHAGMIVTSDILDDPRVKPGKIYIWESTLSGRLTDGVKNVDGKVKFGVQLRDFDKVMKGYDNNKHTRIAVCSHKSIPNLTPMRKRLFTEFFKRVNGTGYDFNPRSLLSAAVPCFRQETTRKEDNSRLFCSELVAYTWINMGFLPYEVEAKHVLPQDFIGDDADGMPCIVHEPSYITVFPKF